MKQERHYPRFTVTPKAERSVKGGHPWVYGEEVTDVRGRYAPGDLVDVVGRGDVYLGTGFVNDHSKICVRLISANANDRFDAAFFERRLRYALNYRKSVMGGQYGCCRLIFGDSDGFPGLTVDRFDDVLVAEVLSLGMDKMKPLLFPMLVRLLRGVNLIPLVGGANRLLGLVLGLVTGAFDCWLLALLLWFAASITTGQIDWLTTGVLQRSVGYSLFGAFNPFLLHY